MPNPTVTWTTPSGNKYTYEVFAFGTTFNNVGGNYIFAYQTTTGWTAVYIGQTNDLGVRLANHEKLPDAKKKGATHILAHTNSTEKARKGEEAELIAFCKPPCNDQLK